MLKKFFVTALLTIAIIFAGNNSASAKDVYVGTSNTTGRDCYLMTETIKHYAFRGGTQYEATLKMVRRSDGNIQYLYYKFYENRDKPIFTNSQGYEGMIDQYKTPIEWNMFFAMQNYL